MIAAPRETTNLPQKEDECKNPRHKGPEEENDPCFCLEYLQVLPYPPPHSRNPTASIIPVLWPIHLPPHPTSPALVDLPHPN